MSESMLVNEVSCCSVTENKESGNVQVIPFAVQLTVSDLLDFDEPSLTLRVPTSTTAVFLDNKGIVGTILIMNQKSVLIWFGWGQLATDRCDTRSYNDEEATKRPVMGAGTNVDMGPLVIGMPRTRYQGAFSENSEGSASKLIGSENDAEESLARNIATRLSMKLGIPVMLSCSFEGCPATAEEGAEAGVVQHRAAVQAERKIFEILKTTLKKE